METKALVVGAGPTGLLLAAELRRREVECVLIEAHEEPLRWDRATVVHPRTLEAFAVLGIAEDFVAEGVHQTGIEIHSAGQLLGELDLGSTGSPFGYNLDVSEEVTERHLERFLRSHGGEVSRGRRLTALEQDGEGVTATVESAAGDESLRAEWVVGCGGLHSPSRELTGIPFEGHDIAAPWAVFDTTLAGWPNRYDRNYGYFDQPPVILTPLPGRRWRVYLRPSSPEADLVAEAAAVIARYAPGVEPVEVADPTRFHCHTKVAARYREGRVLVAGDAAHVCTPGQGHGMNTGIQDAFNLGWKLAMVCRNEAEPALLDSYEAERRPVAQAITASGDAMEEMLARCGPGEREARDAELRAVFADPETRHHEEVAEVELEFEYADSPIVGSAAGTRLAAELHDHLVGARGHHLLVLGPEPDPLARRLEGELADGLFERVAAHAADEEQLLAVRPDGIVGAFVEGTDPAPLLAYVEKLRRGGAAAR